MSTSCERRWWYCSQCNKRYHPGRGKRRSRCPKCRSPHRWVQGYSDFGAYSVVTSLTPENVREFGEIFAYGASRTCREVFSRYAAVADPRKCDVFLKRPASGPVADPYLRSTIAWKFTALRGPHLPRRGTCPDAEVGHQAKRGVYIAAIGNVDA